MYKELLTIRKQKFLFQKWADYLTRQLTKEDVQMAVSIWKDALHHMSLGKCKLKQPLDATAKIQHRDATAENVELQEPSCIAGGNSKWDSHFGRQCDGFSQNQISSYTRQYRNYTAWYLPKRIENLHQHTSLHMGVYSSLFRLAQIWSNKDVLRCKRTRQCNIVQH